MQGMHQLANRLSSRGLPLIKSDDLRPGVPGTAAGSSKAGSSLFTSCDRNCPVVRLDQPPRECAKNPDDQNDREKAKSAAHCAIHLRQARRPCPPRANSPPRPIRMPPNQIR